MFQFNVPLSFHSHYKIGGPAKYFYQPKNIGDLTTAIEKAKANRWPIFVLGGGTNILWNDSGFPGLVIKPIARSLQLAGDLITADAGAPVADLLELTATKGLAGLEWAGGLPGLAGGAVRGNAGAFGGEIQNSIIEVISLDFSGKQPKIVRRSRRQCHFGYRDSIFKSGPKAGQEIILEAVFQLRSGNKKDIRRVIEDKILWRKTKQPLDYPNIGSIFKNIDWRLVPVKWQKNTEFLANRKTDPFPVLPAAFLIHRAGLKGVSRGGAMISQKHPNFIVNACLATARDVEALIKLTKSVAFKKYGVKLDEEIVRG